jgi:hypothetical protein
MNLDKSSLFFASLQGLRPPGRRRRIENQVRREIIAPSLALRRTQIFPPDFPRGRKEKTVCISFRGPPTIKVRHEFEFTYRDDINDS